MIHTKPIDAKGPLGKALIAQGINTYEAATQFICQLPYGRNANRHDLLLLVSEQKGTCSSKHAFLKQLAIEQSLANVKLILCIYAMNGENTPGIGRVLQKHQLDFIPEAHCYLEINGKAYDFTNPDASITKIADDILFEQAITPEQVNTFKPTFHQQFIKDWRTKTESDYSFELLWKIREECIQALEA